MKKRILWIEDDYYAIKGLVRPLEQEGFWIDAATSAAEGYKMAANWRSYDLIVVDLILPLTNDAEPVPEKVRSWQSEEYIGVGLLKWLKLELKAEVPVMILSVVLDPTRKFHLESLNLTGYLPKRGLLPSRVKEEVFRLLGIGKTDARDSEQAGGGHAGR